MSTELPKTGLQLRTHIKPEGVLELSLAEVEIEAPGSEEVVVRIEASPINPSDLGLLLGPADLSTARVSGTADRPVLTAEVSASRHARHGRTNGYVPASRQ